MTLPKIRRDKVSQSCFMLVAQHLNMKVLFFTDGWMDSAEPLPDLLFIQVPGNCLLFSIPGRGE